MNKKLLIKIGTGILFLVVATYFYSQEKVPNFDKPLREVTFCGSTVPTTCYRYSCENSYLVPDEDFKEFRVPGGPNRNKMCTDGTKAKESIK